MIYLLHSTVALGGVGSNSARHYLGWCHEDGLWRRVREHQAGTATAAITRAFVAAGGSLLLVAILPGGSRADERALKTMGHAKRLCPICNPKRPMGGTEWPAIALIPRRGLSTLRLRKLLKANGGALQARKRTRRTSRAGASPPAPLPANSTPSGGPAPLTVAGGRS